MEVEVEVSGQEFSSEKEFAQAMRKALEKAAKRAGLPFSKEEIEGGIEAKRRMLMDDPDGVIAIRSARSFLVKGVDQYIRLASEEKMNLLETAEIVANGPISHGIAWAIVAVVDELKEVNINLGRIADALENQ